LSVWVTGTLLVLLAALQIWFGVLETYFWQRPLGRKTFGTSEQVAADSAVLAANQGLYNWILAAGLIWGLLADDPLRQPVRGFFLVSVLVAGLVGGATANRRIWVVQALPAAVGLVGLLVG
jgi:putative membrane protein